MENVRIAILSNMDKVCAFMDNEAVDGLHYWDDELHRYLSGSTNTFSFKADATHEDSIYLTVGNKISFRYKMRDYYFNIVSSVRDEDVVEVEAFALIFELLNEYSSEYTAAKAMTFAEYIDAFDYEKTLTLGINEVSDKSIKHEWTGTNTILARLFSLANVFSAEIEILPQLNMDYSLNSLILNVYREHSEQYQGIGANRVDKILRYGVEVEGITKTSDVTELYTSIKPIGKDGLTLVGMSKIEVDENGEQEYVLLDHDGIIRAVQARDRFPSNIMGKRNDGYILRNWSYETENVNMLYGQALAQLKKDCVPQVSYDVKGYFDLGIGDTVVVCDEEYNPELYLSVRVVEQSISFTDPSNNKTTVGNVRELQSELDLEILERVYMLEAAVGAADNKYATKDNLEETNKNVTNVTNKVSNLENVVADKVSTEELEAQVARIATLETNNATINSKLTANEASINSLVAKDAEIDGKLTAQDASIKKLDAEKLSAEDANLTYATIESLKATDATITNLSGDYASFKNTTTETLKAQTADIVDLKADKLSATDADFRYANIDFTNIGKAAMEYFYAQSGLIKDVTVGDQTITGELVGVTIKGNLIEGDTVTADKLVVKGEDGLYYKLNINALGETTVKADEKYQNGLDGSVLIKKSIVAEKISVKDLVAFGATIGGVNIADSSIYSGVKSSVNNTTRGFYLGKDGQAAFGDASNYLKYFQDTDGTWKLAISADSMSLKSGTNIGDAIENIQGDVDGLKESGGFNWNLIPKSKNLDLQILESTMTATRTDSDCTLSVKTAVGESSSTWGALYSNLTVEKNQWYTASVEVTNIEVSEYSSAAMFTVCKNPPTIGSWNEYGLKRIYDAGKYEITFNSGDNTAIRVCVGIIRKAVSNTATFKNIKLEKGSVATAWTPAESEIYGKDGARGPAGKDGVGFSWNLLRKSQEIFLNSSDYPNNSTRERGKITVLSSGDPFNAYTWVEDNMVVPPADIVKDAGSIYTFSADIKTTNFDGSFVVYFALDLRINFQVKLSKLVAIPSNKNGEWQRLSGTLTIPDNLYTAGDWKSLASISTNGVATAKAGVTFEYRNLKLEKNSVSTDWSPAEEDIYGSSLITLATNYSYPQADINMHGKSGYSGTWTVASSLTVKVGDTVLLRVTNTTKNGYSYIIATVTAIPSTTSVTCVSTGLLDKGETGSDGVNGNSMIVAPVSYGGNDYYPNYSEASITVKVANKSRDSFQVSSTTGIKIGDIALCKCITSDTKRITYMMLLVDTVNMSSSSIKGTVIGQSTGQNGATGPQGDKGETGATGPQGKPGIDFSQGKMLYTDPMFNNGTNGISVYNNTANGNVTISRMAKTNDNPITDATYNLCISNTGSANPALGGFYFGNTSRCNAIFVYRFIAWIPSGYTIEFDSNTAGGVYSGEWLTSNVGDGNFREYIHRIQCGRNGQYSSTGFFYLNGPVGTADNPVKWWLAYATCYDMTATSDVISLNTSLDVTKESITALASRTSSVEGRISTAESSIKQNADAISLKVSQSDFNNLQVGGRNLLVKTNGNTSQTLTYPSSSYSDSRGWNTTVKMNDGYYTLSFWAKSTHAGDIVRVHLYSPSNVTNIIDSLGRSQGYTADGLCDFPLTTTMTKYWVTYSVPKDDQVRSVIIARMFPGYGSGTVTINREKLEAGAKATDWTPAPEDQVNIGDVTSQLNSELKIGGNILAMTTGHFLVNSTNLTITADGTLTAANGYFKGKIEATSGYFGTYNPPTGSDDAWNPSYWLSADNGIIAMQAHSIRNTGNVSCSSDSATMSSYSSGGGHSSVQCAAGNLDLSASESLVLNGTDWDSLVYRQAGYDWSTFNTANTTDTWVPVMNGSKVNHRVLPTDVTDTTDGGCFQKRNKIVTVNGWGVGASSIIFNLPATWRPVKGNGVFSGFCYNISNHAFYPVTGNFDTKGVPSVYAISTWNSAYNNYAIYNSSTDRRSNFQLYVTGSWLAN